MPGRLRHLDPLVLFLALGAVLAVLHAWTREEEAEGGAHRIVVTDADVAWIAEAFAQGRRRPPTPDELRALVDQHVRDEVLFREAVALGLDRDDPGLRRRLAMKLEYLAKDAGAAVEPSPEELQAFLDEHAERYAEPPRRAFLQVYVSTAERGAAAAADAEALLADLRRAPDQDLSELGDTILLEIEHPLSTPAEVGARFGDGFAQALFLAEPGAWSGPIRSGFGLHLVRVVDAREAAPAQLEAVRDRVRNDLLQRRREYSLDAYVRTLLEKYEVDIRAAAVETEGSGP